MIHDIKMGAFLIWFLVLQCGIGPILYCLATQLYVEAIVCTVLSFAINFKLLKPYHTPSAKKTPTIDPWYVAKCEGHESLDPPNVNSVPDALQQERSDRHNQLTALGFTYVPAVDGYFNGTFTVYADILFDYNNEEWNYFINNLTKS